LSRESLLIVGWHDPYLQAVCSQSVVDCFIREVFLLHANRRIEQKIPPGAKELQNSLVSQILEDPAKRLFWRSASGPRCRLDGDHFLGDECLTGDDTGAMPLTVGLER
jgi:hypothetical protein